MIHLQPNESLLLLRRRHWLILVFSIARIGLGILVVLAAPFVLRAYLPEVTEGYGAEMLFGELIVVELLWLALFLAITDYYLDAWLVTSGRLVFVELHGIFSRTLSSIEFSRIQDISVEVKGIIPTFFKYGNIKIFTAGNEQGFVFEEVPRPYELKDELLAIRDRLRRGEDAAVAEAEHEEKRTLLT